MPSIRDTAYPELKVALSAKELADVYTPNFVELVWTEKRTREPAPRVGLLALLKTFQRLGYFVSLTNVPVSLLDHIARSAGYDSVPAELFHYDVSSVRRRQMLLIRDYAGVKAWGEDAQAAMEKAGGDAARTLEDLPDIINVILEQLVRQRFFPRFPFFNGLRSTPARWPTGSISRWSATGSMQRRVNDYPSCLPASTTKPRAHGTD